ncbi:UV-damaged DNA-binding protein rad7 [Dispira parvispora]|uniref:UV-damaged DNA-binding protein rad7 n=1 Tax=Dispira parvispora TaxID=1520584 RepID=A0A9W8APR7_9FUNG|nr:UV-damaged DNA-binding protein rad7 [Dispira parvispora]
MSNNRRNRVRGPHSALTSFLQEQGISLEARALARARHEQQLQTNRPEQPLSESPDGSSAEDSTISEPAATGSPERDLGSEVETTTPIASSARRVRKKSKKPAESDSDSDFQNQPGPSRPRPKKRTHKGKMIFCRICKARFLRKFADLARGASSQADDDICPPCKRSAMKGIPQAKPRAKRRQALTRRKNVGYESHDGPLPLVDSCIQIISKYIHDVETLGDIGDVNMDKICRIISKRRLLTPESLQLFLRPDKLQLRLYDVTRLTAPHLTQITVFCPYLTELHLDFCGRMDDETLGAVATRCTELRSIHLHGPFLVTDEAFAHFFQHRADKLKTISLSQASRLAQKGIRSLASQARGLTTLKLMGCEHVDDESLMLLTEPAVSVLELIEHLDISRPGAATTVGGVYNTYTIQDSTILRMITRFGSRLRALNLNGCHTLSDRVLHEGILPHCSRLHSLELSECAGLTSFGMASFFILWRDRYPQGAHLNRLDLSRCDTLDDAVVETVVYHSGHSLENLNLNGLMQLTDAAFVALCGGVIFDDRWKQRIVRQCLEKARQYVDQERVDNQQAPHNGPEPVETSEQPDTTNPSSPTPPEPTATEIILGYISKMYQEMTAGMSIDQLRDEEEVRREDAELMVNNDTKDNQPDDPFDHAKLTLTCRKLSTVDLSWCRAVNDDTLTHLLSYCPQLQYVALWGCNHVTDCAPRRPGLRYVGRECDTN